MIQSVFSIYTNNRHLEERGRENFSDQETEVNSNRGTSRDVSDDMRGTSVSNMSELDTNCVYTWPFYTMFTHLIGSIFVSYTLATN